MYVGFDHMHDFCHKHDALNVMKILLKIGKCSNIHVHDSTKVKFRDCPVSEELFCTAIYHYHYHRKGDSLLHVFYSSALV